MTGNGIGVRGAKAMSEMLKVNTTLTTLNLGGDGEDNIKKKEKERRITGNWIGAEGAKAISEMLKVNTTLKALYLHSENEIKTEKERERNNKQ